MCLLGTVLREYWLLRLPLKTTLSATEYMISQRSKKDSLLTLSDPKYKRSKSSAIGSFGGGLKLYNWTANCQRPRKRLN